jgi:cyanophycinase
MRRRLFLAFTIAFWGLTASLPAATHGPRNGWLVIIGGGEFGQEIWDRFFELAGGMDQPIVVIPTAGDADTYNDLSLATIRRAGATNVTLLHTRDRKVADSEAFVEPLRKARGVFFSGGRQWRLADSYLGTRTEKELRALLDRGGVIAGSSAGATIIGSLLVRGAVSGNEIMVSPDHTQGMAFLTDSAIDQHLIARHREKDLVPVINKRPQLLGIGLDERTAIVVHGDQFEVAGASKVAIYTAGHPYYFLKAGDRFDLIKREPIAPAANAR